MPSDTACAGDIAISCLSISQLVIIHNIFNLFASVSGLVLSPDKCVLILVSAVASPHNVQLVRQWLEHNIPERSLFEISNSGVYLGFQVGPSAGKLIWKSALHKFLPG